MNNENALMEEGNSKIVKGWERIETMFLTENNQKT